MPKGYDLPLQDTVSTHQSRMAKGYDPMALRRRLPLAVLRYWLNKLRHAKAMSCATAARTTVASRDAAVLWTDENGHDGEHLDQPITLHI